jgi:pyruvate dehydrogenase E2 component (dihydrolipoamide acetyltransferase)
MAREFRLPDLGEGLTEAEVVAVLVREGDVVQEDAPLLQVETDKAQVEIPSPMSGRVERIHVRPNQTVKVGEVLVTFGDTRAPAPAPVAAAPAPVAPVPAPVAARDGTAAASAAIAPGPAAARQGPVPATPATRRLARELGVDLRAVAGTGPGERVTDADVRAAASGRDQPSASAARAAPRPPAEGERRALAKPLAQPVAAPPLPRFEQWGPVERRPLSHLRRTIAERMTLAAALIPHVTHFDRADITELEALIRRNLDAGREQGVTLTLTAFLLKAAALALQEHPDFNASLDPERGELILKRHYHLGVAVATDRGLIVPVLRDVDRKPMLALARELGALAQRVREGKATLEELRGGTFTVTNIGALGGTGATPIINYPEVAILGVARGREEAVVLGGQIVPRLLLPLSITFDHRVADGADAARFLADVVRRLEAPERLLLEL